MNIICIIPAKSSSTRLPNKNIAEILGKPLLEWAVIKAERTKIFNSIYIDTDSKEYFRKVEHHNVKWIKRDTNVGDHIHDVVSSSLCAIGNLRSNDIICHLHCTTPFLLHETIKNAVLLMKKNKCQYSYFSAMRKVRYDWTRFEDRYVPLYNIIEMPRSQDVNPSWEETHGFYIFTPEQFYTHGTRYGQRPLPYEISPMEAYDIDDKDDFRIACSIAEPLLRSYI